MELPPLARGRALLMPGGDTITGITPACAGKSLRVISFPGCEGNYPRLRGEEPSVGMSLGFGAELPPLARGRGSGLCAVHGIAGITPACAGKRFDQFESGFPA